MTAWVEIDGAEGEGGGQVLRTALACSLVTGRPLHVHDIRARRARPGLLRQHLVAVQMAARIGNAAVRGDTLGSREIRFEPQVTEPGTYELAIGSAGSTTLVVQTVLLPLLLADGRSRLALEGGTHNPLAPTFDYLDRVFLPVLRRMGAGIDARLVRPGFHPKGGGRIEIAIQGGVPLHPIALLERGPIVATRAEAWIANLPRHIAQRELDVIARALGWRELEIVEVGGPGPGNVLQCELRSEGCSELFTAFGERGKPAERVAKEAADAVLAHLAHDFPVGEHLADQLLLPMALFGGRFRTAPLSLHATTNLAVLQRFLDVRATVTDEPGGVHVDLAPL